MTRGARNTYFGNIGESIASLWKGFLITFRHFLNAKNKRKQVSLEDSSYFNQPDGIFTVRYPLETIPIPDNGRYRLHNEMDDCIVCDLCAKVCPVDCIEIEPVKSTEEIGKTSDGSTKRLYAAKFDIDMAKCCYCGLCTTVCPTECLTMTKTFDYSEFDVRNMVYHFTDLSPEQAEEKKEAYELAQAEKNRLKAEMAKNKELASKAVVAGIEETSIPEKNAVLPVKDIDIPNNSNAEPRATPKPLGKPVFKPKPIIAKKSGGASSEGQQNQADPAQTAKPIFKPSRTSDKEDGENKADNVTGKNIPSAEPTASPKPLAKPVFKPRPIIAKKSGEVLPEGQQNQPESAQAVKPIFKPSQISDKEAGESQTNNAEEKNEKGSLESGETKKIIVKPVIKPIIPKKKDPDTNEE
jgi:formate hydrogenlyase subunit 6/NADH:ubiquinone oxidoreductase subunit I